MKTEKRADKERVCGMRIIKILCLITAIVVTFTTIAYAAEANFTASLLTAKDVDCKKCHTDTPHIIHAKKPVECVNCHGDKLSVSIPICTKCHDGPIHQVHAGKVSTQTCSYCHKNIGSVHNALISDAVCSHCHSDLLKVHGDNTSCTKCHKSAPSIVKPVKLEGMTLICQNCHANTSVATVHGLVEDKNGCYECHRGTSKVIGSEVPHIIHATLVDCKGCHEENQQVVVPKCTRCHDVDALHAFNKIGKLTAQSGLECSACHPGETKLSGPQTSPPEPEETAGEMQTISAPAETAEPQGQQSEGLKTPGFKAMMLIGALIIVYMVQRRRRI